MTRTIFRLLPVAAALLLSSSTASALVDLTRGQRLMAVDGVQPRQDRITFRFTKDPGLFALENPLCPAVTKIQFLTQGQVTAEQLLDCTKWKVAGTGFRYVDNPVKPGSVRRIQYRVGTLVVTLQGVPYANDALAGPVDFVETRVTIGGAEYCARWDQPPGKYVRNVANRIVIRGPTTACQVQCGNQIVEAPEQCDDGDLESGDCCGATCDLRPAGSSCESDGNVCTDDVCDGAGACVHTPNVAPCDDGSSCTSGDTCVGGVRVGEPSEPWINEIDYDGLGNGDEFIEIAGPAGKDLSGYQVGVVEGGGPLCLTSGAAVGQAYSIGTIPNGTVLGNDNGKNVGFLVVCFAGTSSSVAGCDVVLPGDGTNSNLKDGDLANLNATGCPDGVLLLDDSGDYVDSTSWEGIVPASGPFGPLFHTFPAYAT